jgi:uncharacterized protein (UPF0216 family)
MKTLIFRERIFKSSILFLTVSAFILATLLLTSCSDSEMSDSMVTDETVLIEKIESATKIAVTEERLPAATEITFRGELADSYVVSAQLAVGLGYKVAIVTDNESKEEAMSTVYFSLQGKYLADTNAKRIKKRHKCFDFVYPLDFIMPDDSAITLESKEDWGLIRAWYALHTDVKERPELLFPVDVTLEDGTLMTLIDRDELKRVKDSCKKGKDKRKCFKLVLPVSFTMPDATIINVTERADFRFLKEWRKANPDTTEKGSLNFPVVIEHKDGTTTTTTVNDQAEFEAAKDAC